MNTLKDVARKNHSYACQAYSKMFDDELEIGFACFNIEQAIEKLLKFWIQQNGGRFERSHEIASLCVHAEKLGLDIPVEIEILAEPLKKWATFIKYEPNFVATKKIIDMAFKVHDDLLRSIETDLHARKIKQKDINADPDAAE